jgi:lysyl-tRNA synthetase class II
LFEHLVVFDLYSPPFVKDIQVDTCPPTRRHRSGAGLVEK